MQRYLCSSVDKILELLAEKRWLLYSYSGSYLTGGFLAILLRIERRDSKKSKNRGHKDQQENDNGDDSDSFLLDPENPINIIFANYAILWYIGLFWSIIWMRRFMEIKASNEQIKGIQRFVNRMSIMAFTRFSVILFSWLLVFSWFFGNALAERIAELTGINISGHFWVLSSAGMSLILELKKFIDEVKYYSEDEGTTTSTSTFSHLKTILDNDKQVHLCYVLQAFTLFIIILWFFIFTTTALFFHSFFEKFIGLFGSYVLIMVNYSPIYTWIKTKFILS